MHVVSGGSTANRAFPRPVRRGPSAAHARRSARRSRVLRKGNPRRAGGFGYVTDVTGAVRRYLRAFGRPFAPSWRGRSRFWAPIGASRDRTPPLRANRDGNAVLQRAPTPARADLRRCSRSIAAVKVTLPDGTPLELPDGATGADAAAAIGPGLARAALAVKQDGEVRDLARPLLDGEPLEIITAKSGRDALDLIRHDAAHVLATAVMELYPGVKISIGPPIESGFYYDFEFPDGVTVTEADFPAIEERMREHVAADEPFVREDVTPHEALERFRGRGPGLQGRADRGPRRGRRRRHRLALHERPVHRPLPRPARAGDRPHRRVQAAVGRRRLLARRREPPDAHARLRHRVLQQEGARGAPRAARAGARARPPQARPAARPVPVLRGLAGLGVLAAEGHGDLQPARRAHAARWAPSAATPRSRRRCSTTASCGRPRATGASTARTCSSRSPRAASSASSR